VTKITGSRYGASTYLLSKQLRVCATELGNTFSYRNHRERRNALLHRRILLTVYQHQNTVRDSCCSVIFKRLGKKRF
jgi:hypothetical protein